MNMGDDVTSVALSALFALCVPAVSGDVLEQTFPSQLVVDLTPEERVRYDIPTAHEAWRIVCGGGFILLEVEDGSCRVITEDGAPAGIRASFLTALSEAGGTVRQDLSSEDDPTGLVGEIPLVGQEYFVLVFFRPGDVAGFYGAASAHQNRKLM